MKPNFLKIGTFNLFNLVLPNHKYYGESYYTPEEYAKKVKWIGHQLESMNADIVGFQEVFHLEALREAVKASGIYENVTIVGTNPTGEKPTVALLSRFPVLGTEIIEDFPENSIIEAIDEDTQGKIALPYTKFSRAILKVRILVHNKFEIAVYVIHLKSKRPIVPSGADRNDPIETAKGKARSLMVRAAESTALRSVLMKDLLNKDYPVVVMGDVNDTGMAVTTRIISGESPMRKFPQDVKNKIWDTLLYHVKDIQARQSYSDFYYTHIHNGHYEGLDQMMVSQELVRENPRNVGKVIYVTLFNDHLVDETLIDQKMEKWKSDHGQVVTVIEMK